MDLENVVQAMPFWIAAGTLTGSTYAAYQTGKKQEEQRHLSALEARERRLYVALVNAKADANYDPRFEKRIQMTQQRMSKKFGPNVFHMPRENQENILNEGKRFIALAENRTAMKANDANSLNTSYKNIYDSVEILRYLLSCTRGG